jgi:hypothetical protein
MTFSGGEEEEKLHTKQQIAAAEHDAEQKK